MYVKKILLGLMLIMGMLPHLACASVVLSPSQREWVHRIEESLVHTRTVQASFRQVGMHNQVTTGTVVLARPGRMRFTYDPPTPLLVVANDGKVVFQDSSIGQVTTLPLNKTPLGLLLRSNPHFSGDVSILGYHQDRDKIALDVVSSENPGDGELTVFFQMHPLRLEGWTVLDAQGTSTSIHLLDVVTGGDVAPHVFDLPKEE